MYDLLLIYIGIAAVFYIFTSFIFGLRGEPPEISHATMSIIFPVTIASVLGVLLRGLYLIYKERT